MHFTPKWVNYDEETYRYWIDLWMNYGEHFRLLTPEIKEKICTAQCELNFNFQETLSKISGPDSLEKKIRILENILKKFNLNEKETVLSEIETMLSEIGIGYNFHGNFLDYMQIPENRYTFMQCENKEKFYAWLLRN